MFDVGVSKFNESKWKLLVLEVSYESWSLFACLSLKLDALRLNLFASRFCFWFSFKHLTWWFQSVMRKWAYPKWWSQSVLMWYVESSDNTCELFWRGTLCDNSWQMNSSIDFHFVGDYKSYIRMEKEPSHFISLTHDNLIKFKNCRP